MKYISILFISLYMVSCGNSKDATAMNKLTQLNGDYKISMVGADSSFNEDVTIQFNSDEKTVSGNSGCNLFNGSYTSEGSKLEFGSLATTRKMCDTEANTLEQNVLKALQNTKSYSISTNEISFYDEAHFTILKLENSDTMSAKITTSQSDYQVEYSAVSRGTFLMITYENGSILFQKDRDSKKQTKTLLKDEVVSIEKKIAAINIASLDTLEPPSKAHQYDGAAGATLKVTENETSYQTATFDHGNPPKALEALVSELISLTEKL
ncbi:META domain-containing protein [Bizionia myxarmorum]|uniref:META domain-containing protein n=1 Tax=Bizionia myxarmorum TaxID=291186 RepID=A0A5D0REE3_9FLAO|nr:META domain-containing protein [Bizionia myxarmorum]TYB78924.1 META domain-containing protein [Bizionia myxarmorum]